jgi:hypothetical protein
VFGRPFPQSLPWFAEDAEENADMWAPADQSREQLLDLYQRVGEHADATIDALDLDATGHVPWWPQERAAVTLHQILVHMVAEMNRHAGHADILREQIDSAAGVNRRNASMPDHDADWWAAYRARVEQAAQEARDRG